MDSKGRRVLGLKADQRDEETVKAIIKLLQEKETNIDRAFRILEDARSMLLFIAVLPPVNEKTL